MEKLVDLIVKFWESSFSKPIFKVAGVIAIIFITGAGSLLGSLQNMSSNAVSNAKDVPLDSVKEFITSGKVDIKGGLTGIVTGAIDSEFEDKMNDATDGLYDDFLFISETASAIYGIGSITPAGIGVAAAGKAFDTVVKIYNGESILPTKLSYYESCQVEAEYMNDVVGFGNWEMFGGEPVEGLEIDNRYTDEKVQAYKYDYHYIETFDVPPTNEVELEHANENIKYLCYMTSVYNILYVPVSGNVTDEDVPNVHYEIYPDRRNSPGIQGNEANYIYQFGEAAGSYEDIRETIYEYRDIKDLAIVGSCFMVVLDDMMVPIKADCYRAIDPEHDKVVLARTPLKKDSDVYYYEVQYVLMGDQLT